VAGVDPTLTVGDLRIRKGDVGKVVAKVPVTLDRPAPVDSVVQYQISGGTATPGVDFASPTSGVKVGNTTIRAGHTSTSVSVTVLNDTVPEQLDKTVAVDILSAPGLDVGRGHGDLTIIHNDGGATTTTPTLSVGAPTVWEGNVGVRTALVPVTLSVPAPAPVSVHVSAEGTLPDNWQNLNPACPDLSQLRVLPLDQTVTFDTGQQSKQVDVQVNGNFQPDPLDTNVGISATVVSGAASLDPLPTVVVDDDGSTVAPPPPGTYRVSEPAEGSDPTFGPGSGASVGCDYPDSPQSNRASVSADGRYVLFSSNADNLVGNDINGEFDAFVKDTWTGAIERVNTAADGSPASDGYTRAESISADGRYVTFSSNASNLVADGHRGSSSFVKDRVTGAIVRLGGSNSDAQSMQSFIGGDNRSVVFASSGPPDGSCTTSCPEEVYLYDVVTGTYTLISTGAFAGATHPVISNDGKHVAFLGWNGSVMQVYVKDLDTGVIEMVSVNNAGEPASGVWGTYILTSPAISADGQIVAWSGQYCNAGLPSLPCGDGTIPYTDETWVRDRAAGTLTVGSVLPTGDPATTTAQEQPSLSADGRYVAFNTQGSVWLHDRVAGTTERIDSDIDGNLDPASVLWSPEALTPDASSIVFSALDGSEPVSRTNPEAVYITKRN